MTTDARFLLVKEVAEILRCHEDTVIRRIGSGELPATRRERIYLVASDDLESYLLSRSTRPPAARRPRRRRAS